jgi:hypothetical protein
LLLKIKVMNINTQRSNKMGFKKTYFIIFAYINKAEFIEYFNQHCKKFCLTLLYLVFHN